MRKLNALFPSQAQAYGIAEKGAPSCYIHTCTWMQNAVIMMYWKVDDLLKIAMSVASCYLHERKEKGHIITALQLNVLKVSAHLYCTRMMM